MCEQVPLVHGFASSQTLWQKPVGEQPYFGMQSREEVQASRVMPPVVYSQTVRLSPVPRSGRTR